MNNIEVYTKKMSYSLEDKLFFTKQVDMNNINIFIDFGCADGALIEALSDMYPHLVCIGYDNSVEMEKRFNQRLGSRANVHFVNSLSQLIEVINTGRKCKQIVAVNFSSVLHEIYTYQNSAQTWHKIIGAKPNYIFIRDMGYGLTETKPTVMSFVNKLSTNEMFMDYAAHRSIDTLAGVVEFLLKYDYTENWERERDEKYFYPEDYFTVPESYYEYYFHRFNLEYHVNKIKKDFDIDISKINTHYKAIYMLTEGQ